MVESIAVAVTLSLVQLAPASAAPSHAPPRHHAASPSPSPSPVPAASIDVTIEKAWESALPSGTYTHVRVRMLADRDVTVRVSGFSGNILMPGGFNRAIYPLTNSAPTASGQNAALSSFGLSNLRSPSPHPVVSPNEDFGALGEVGLRANAPAEIVITIFGAQPTTDMVIRYTGGRARP